MTPPHSGGGIVPAIPIPGWAVTYDGPADGTGEWKAVRKTQLTAYQIALGALPSVRADDPGEIYILCDAQTRLAERLATAETLGAPARKRRREDRERRIAEVRSISGAGADDVGSGPGPRPA